ncbi:nuclear transport factor 2 family protein [Microbacterium sp. NEAU-LLC]|uniref:Nuclear transport factor 2 family protein n=1 Tax=Microbacterium helvum TaxID=2773713 RepID=A0ABR8NNS9_9MICO|nr:nuclear transport factor 2 family protein [Microbacterium helvum]MBD3941437.1 nuclear transport factor 2 family protein [Microbacterium helvum]
MASNIEIVQQLYGAFMQGDIDGVRDRLSADVEWREPAYQGDGGAYTGPDDVIAHLFEGEPVVEDYRLEIVDMLASDHRVAIVAATSGTRDGRPLTNEYIQLVTIADGRVSAVRNYCWDPQALREFFAPAPDPANV